MKHSLLPFTNERMTWIMAKKNDQNDNILHASLHGLKVTIESTEQTLFAMAQNAKVSKEISDSLIDNYETAIEGFRGTLNMQELFERIHQISSDKTSDFKALINLHSNINELCSRARILLGKIKSSHKAAVETLTSSNLSDKRKLVIITEQLSDIQKLMSEFGKMEENYSENMETITSITLEVDKVFKLLMKYNNGLLLPNAAVLSENDEFLYCLFLRKSVTISDKHGNEVATGIIDDYSSHSVLIGTVEYLQDSHSFRVRNH